MNEAQAIARLKAGDIAGLKTLVETHQTEAVHLAFFITRDSPAAEDIVQAAFLRIVEKIKGFDESRPFRPWFLQIVVNDSIKSAIRQNRSTSLLGDNEYQNVLRTLNADPRELEDSIIKTELVKEMRQAIDRLSPSQRGAILLHYVLDLSTAETARQLACAPGTLRWHLSAARERLRTLLSSFK